MKHAIATALLLVLFSSTAFAATWGGHEYSYVDLSTPTYTWAQARAEALSSGWDLVSITSQDELTFIRDLINDNKIQDDLWIGGYQTADSSSPATGWNWVSGEAWSYTNWRSGEPNDTPTPGENNEENFLMLYGYPNVNQGTWNDASATMTLRGYIMERATPIPGAAWLLGSGLIGLIGLRKRMKS